MILHEIKKDNCIIVWVTKGKYCLDLELNLTIIVRVILATRKFDHFGKFANSSHFEICSILAS